MTDKFPNDEILYDIEKLINFNRPTLNKIINYGNTK
jgi:hypothetical protein